MKIRNNSTAKRLSFIILFFIGFQLIASHPFYVSISEIDYKSETKSLEISLRIFTDDLEITLQDWGSEKPYLGELNEIESADSLLKKYISHVLNIEIDGENQTLNYLGKEVEKELTWIYLEAKNIPNFDKITISNRLLVQSFPNQTNLAHVNHRQETKSLLLTKNNPSGELEWEKR